MRWPTGRAACRRLGWWAASSTRWLRRPTWRTCRQAHSTRRPRTGELRPRLLVVWCKFTCLPVWLLASTGPPTAKPARRSLVDAGLGCGVQRCADRQGDLAVRAGAGAAKALGRRSERAGDPQQGACPSGIALSGTRVGWPCRGWCCAAGCRATSSCGGSPRKTPRGRAPSACTTTRAPTCTSMVRLRFGALGVGGYRRACGWAVRD